MRLLNTSTLKFQEFFDDKIPPYSILSHRWTEQEVSCEQYLADQPFGGGYGSTKIAKLCEISRDDGIAWTWIDTCCIDKRSSAELSEAINSMFTWYNKAKVCYAFLPDVHPVVDEGDIIEGTHIRQHDELLSQVTNLSLSNSFLEMELRQSEWFQRGWTLQELLAPQYVLFFNSDFRLIGDRNGLAGIVSEITGIAEVPLKQMHGKDMEITTMGSAGPCFAEKMSWAAGRKTSREEDIAYCLMGLVDVNMPLLYGEGGQRAFIRLQQEYLLRNLDDSIFAWDDSHTPERENEQSGRITDSAARFSILAPGPSAFEGCGDFMLTAHAARLARGISNLGIELELPVPRFLAQSTTSCRIMYLLDCQHHQTSDQLCTDELEPGSSNSDTSAGSDIEPCVKPLPFSESQYVWQRLRRKSSIIDAGRATLSPETVAALPRLLDFRLFDDNSLVADKLAGIDFRGYGATLQEENRRILKQYKQLFLSVTITPCASSVWTGFVESTNDRRLWTKSARSGDYVQTFRDYPTRLDPYVSFWLDMKGRWLREPSMKDKFRTMPHLSRQVIKSWEESDTEKLVQEVKRWDRSIVFRKIAFPSTPIPHPL